MAERANGAPLAQDEPRVGDGEARAMEQTPLARASDGLDLCVHCGFCLQACPTYLALEDENDSPRGRLVLMRALVEGTLAADDVSIERTLTAASAAAAVRQLVHPGVP